MSMMLMAKAFGIKVGNANRKLVLLKLADNANDDGECFPSYQHIADQCEMGRSTVKSHIKALADAGYLVVQERKGAKFQSSNAYKLTLENGKKIDRSKPKRPGKAKGSAADLPPRSTVDPGQTEKGESGADLLARIPADMPGTRDPNAKTFKAWANYAIAYRNRYKTWPVSNQKTSAMLAQLVDRVGAELAPKVAAFYLQMNQQFYLTKLHPVSLLLADCEAIATQCTTGQQVTHAQSRQMDSTQTNLSNLEQAKAMLRERQAKREASSCH